MLLAVVPVQISTAETYLQLAPQPISGRLIVVYRNRAASLRDVT
jgi:hypothetical protein